MGYDFLPCSHFVCNTRSKRVIEKTGFRYFSTTPFTTQYGKVEASMNYICYKEDQK